MLTKDQKRYLEKIPASKRVKIYLFDKKVQKIAENITQSVKKICPDLKVVHMGASALGIAGQKDLDIYAFSEPKDFNKYLPGLTKLLGEPKSKHETFIEWNFKRSGCSVEFYLTDPNSSTMKQQIKVFEILKNNKKLLTQYEELKKSMNGKYLRLYQRKKYEFFNRILNKAKL